jgi:hypothetical protein
MRRASGFEHGNYYCLQTQQVLALHLEYRTELSCSGTFCELLYRLAAQDRRPLEVSYHEQEPATRPATVTSVMSPCGFVAAMTGANTYNFLSVHGHITPV